jgi:hypothetical protein
MTGSAERSARFVSREMHYQIRISNFHHNSAPSVHDARVRRHLARHAASLVHQGGDR